MTVYVEETTEVWMPLQMETVRRIVTLALEEDVGRGDVTSEATVPATARGRATLLQKTTGVVCGLPVFSAVFALLDPQVQVTYVAKEGSWGERRTVAELEGPLRPILMGERTALNFLQRLSGIATTSRQAAELVTGTDVLILDTRKTTPGLRTLEKYAVRVGGCHNHRGGLDDGVLIKENHIRAAGGIAEAIAAARKRVAPIQRIEVEVTNLAELEQAIDAEADIVLYDNGSVEELRAAVSFAAGRVRIEASGGITLANLREVAATGVDYISLGALTHSAGVIDFSLEVS